MRKRKVRLTVSPGLVNVDPNLVNSFTYNKEPPVLSAHGTVPVLKEWGSSISDDEIFNMNDLTEFQATELSVEEGCQKGWDVDSTTSLQEIIPQVCVPSFYIPCLLTHATSPTFTLLHFYSGYLHPKDNLSIKTSRCS
jgi:hypothetical protein